MFIVLGSTGHVGSAVTTALLNAGCAVTAVTRDAHKAAAWRDKGAMAAVVDINDTDGLREVFKTGMRAFLLNPPASPSTDTDKEERRTAHAIVAALEGSGLQKVVAESTYGAQPGDRIGDLSVLYEFEQALAAQPIPTTILRAAYYMSNWDALLPAARDGYLPTMYPADLRLPMVAPDDLGRAAARLLQKAEQDTGIHHVEGPEHYSSQDVADAFSRALGMSVEVVATPREQWQVAYRKLGFSPEAAESYARVTQVGVDEDYEMPDAPDRGAIALQDYVSALVERER